MLSKEKLARINELAKKKKVQGLSADETVGAGHQCACGIID